MKKLLKLLDRVESSIINTLENLERFYFTITLTLIVLLICVIIIKGV